MFVSVQRCGADFAVFVNTGQESDGSDSGARPDEAVTWGKIKTEAAPVKVPLSTFVGRVSSLTSVIYAGFCATQTAAVLTSFVTAETKITFSAFLTDAAFLFFSSLAEKFTRLR